MGGYITKDAKVERAVLIGIITPQQTEEQAKEYIEELDFLAHTAGAIPIKHFLQKLSYADPKTFVGKGKLAEVKEFIDENDIGLVIFDDELGPSQLRNVEKDFRGKNFR